MPTRKEIADHISRSLTHNDAATLDVDAYHEAYVSHSLIVRDNAEWVRLPDHSELPITEISGRWMLESAAPFQNRLFIEGRALDAWTDDAHQGDRCILQRPIGVRDRTLLCTAGP